MDAQDKHLGLLCHRELDAGRTRVAQHVGERLLEDTKDGRGRVVIKFRQLKLTGAAALDAGTRLELLRLPLDGFDETEIV